MKTNDINQILQHGSTVEFVESQLELFKKESLFINLYKSANKPNDIADLDNIPKNDIIPEYKITSFIPASGAASRMFKSLFETLNEISDNPDSFTLEESSNIQSPYHFFANIRQLALYENLKEALAKDGYDIEQLLKDKDYKTILEYLLTDKGMNLGSTPKALIPFHLYDNKFHYAFEEHIAEAISYLSAENRNVYIHYTLSPEHIDRFLSIADKIIPEYERKHNCKIHISTSIQSPSTDTVAVNEDNTLFRNEDGSILFRPGGHGALIYNLNNIDSDVIIIKNIDNVVPNNKLDIITSYRGRLIAHIEHLYTKRNEILKTIADGQADSAVIESALAFIREELMLSLDANLDKLTVNEQVERIKDILDRPMRICGMVKNSGEPGGGPFIVQDNNGNLSKQIIESSQIDHKNAIQEDIFKSSTHFNPVDLVCMTKDYRGSKYDLTKYIDNEASFISHKSKDGKPIKVLELPGLWNGAMSKWITIFVEVPAESFNPVKTVNDLFREVHC